MTFLLVVLGAIYWAQFALPACPYVCAVSAPNRAALFLFAAIAFAALGLGCHLSPWPACGPSHGPATLDMPILAASIGAAALGILVRLETLGTRFRDRPGVAFALHATGFAPCLAGLAFAATANSWLPCG